MRSDAGGLRITRRYAACAAVPEQSRRMFLHGGRSVRSGGAAADAGVRHVRPRHRHERLDVPDAEVGRRLSARSRQGAEQGTAGTDRQVLSLLRQGRRRHSLSHAARHASQGRVLHARLGSHAVRRLHRGLDRISDRARSPEAQVRHRQDAGAEGGVRWRATRKSLGLVSLGSCDGAVHEALDLLRRRGVQTRLHASASFSVRRRRSRSSWPRTRRSSSSSRIATRSCAAC